MLGETERDCLERYCALLRSRLGDELVAIRMFGSAARGDMWPAHSPMHSDVDLLVITRGEVLASTRDELVDETYPFFLECGRQFSPTFFAVDAARHAHGRTHARLLGAGRARWGGRVVIAVISDTHMPRGNRRLPVERLAGADAILHAGDLMELEVLHELQALGPPVHAVRGNVDSHELIVRLPLMRTVEFEGVRIGMVHDAGASQGRLARMRRRFPDADAVVFGHTPHPAA